MWRRVEAFDIYISEDLHSHTFAEIWQQPRLLNSGATLTMILFVLFQVYFTFFDLFRDSKNNPCTTCSASNSVLQPMDVSKRVISLKSDDEMQFKKKTCTKMGNMRPRLA